MKVFEASNIKGNRDKFSGNVIVKSLKEDEIVPVEEIKSVFDFEFNNKTKKMSIFDYGENYKYWLTKKEIEDMKKTIQYGVDTFLKAQEKHEYTLTYSDDKAVNEAAQGIFKELRDDFVYGEKGNKISYFEEKEKAKTVIGAVNYNLCLRDVLPLVRELDEIKKLKPEQRETKVMEIVNAIAQKIFGAVINCFTQLPKEIIDTEKNGRVQIIDKGNDTYRFVAHSEEKEPIFLKQEVIPNSSLEKVTKDFILEDLKDLQKDGYCILEFRPDKAVASRREDGRPFIIIDNDNWEKINKVLDTDIVDAFSYINDADLSSVAENIYTSKVKGLDGDYQYIGKGDAKARNLIHDFIDESKSIYLRDNFDLHTRKDLREAMDRGFSFDELRDFYQTEVEKFVMSQEPDIKKENIEEER